MRTTPMGIRRVRCRRGRNRTDPPRRARGRRYLLFLPAALAVVAIGWLLHVRYTPTPSPSELSRVVRIANPRGCDRARSVRLSDLGGPGLPSGMLRAFAAVCNSVHSESTVRVAVMYLFGTKQAAYDWLSSNNFVLGDSTEYGWRLRGRTLLGNVAFTRGAWRKTLALLHYTAPPN